MSNSIYTQLPQEFTFFIEDAVQDEYIHNRYYFKFPKEWKTCYNREPIIGIRQIFIPKAYRRIEFGFIIERYAIIDGECESDPSESLYFDVKSYIDDSLDLRRLVKNFEIIFQKAIDNNNLGNAFSIDNVAFDIEYSIHPDHKRLSYTQVISPVSTPLHEYRIGIYNYNDDFAAVFNYNMEMDAVRPTHIFNTTSKPLKFYDVWDRHDNLISASFSSLNRRQYIGFSEERFNPIKYYKLNQTTDGFWIEFWNSRNRDCPNVLPSDNKEGLIIEAILLESGNEI